MTPIIGNKGPQIEPVIEVVEPDQQHTATQEMKLAGDIGNELAKTYPGYYWLVNVNFFGGIATIECGQINSEVRSNLMYGYVVHLHNLADWGSGRKRILKMAGELLERAEMSRGKWDGDFPGNIDGVRANHQPGVR
jgi:hypothetical protein